MKAFSIIVLCVFVTRCLCRPNGAPPEACSSLIPQHPPSVPMEGSGPYSLDVSIPSVGYDPGNGYKLTLSSTNPTVTFRGLVIQARTRPNNDLVGSFIIVDNETRVQECRFSAEDPISLTGTVTHSGRTDKSSVTLNWVTPPAGTGTIQFVYSVVANYSTYWVFSRSLPFFEDTAVMHAVDDLHYSECGDRRACYLEPCDCRGPLCTYAATWMVDPIAGTIEVEMIHNGRGWIALGFSDDNQMGDDDVFVCQGDVDGTSVLIKDTYNPGGYTPNRGEDNQNDISDVEWSNINTLISCRFRRTLVGNGINDGNVITDKDLSTGEYYMFFAVGDTDGNSQLQGVGGMHRDTPKMTTGRRSPADVSKVEIEGAKCGGGRTKVGGYYILAVTLLTTLLTEAVIVV